MTSREPEKKIIARPVVLIACALLAAAVIAGAYWYFVYVPQQAVPKAPQNPDPSYYCTRAFADSCLNECQRSGNSPSCIDTCVCVEQVCMHRPASERTRLEMDLCGCDVT